jgi:hypothetical protein
VIIYREFWHIRSCFYSSSNYSLMDTEVCIARNVMLHDVNSHSVAMTDTLDLQAQPKASLSEVRFHELFHYHDVIVARLASRKDRCSVGLSNLDDRTARFSNTALSVQHRDIRCGLWIRINLWKILALQTCRRVYSRMELRSLVQRS